MLKNRQGNRKGFQRTLREDRMEINACIKCVIQYLIRGEFKKVWIFFKFVIFILCAIFSTT